MPQTTSTGLPTPGADLRRIWSEFAEMLSLRRQLVETEIRSDIATSKRLGLIAAIGLVISVTGLPVMVSALTRYFDALAATTSGTEAAVFPWISLGTGLLLLLFGLLTAGIAWWRFRRDLLVLRESIAELKEDLVWLREWIDHEEDDHSK